MVGRRPRGARVGGGGSGRGRGRGRGRGHVNDRSPGTFLASVDQDENTDTVDDPEPASNENQFIPVPSSSDNQEPTRNVTATDTPNTTPTNDQEGTNRKLVPGELIKPEIEVKWSESPWILYGFFQNLTKEFSR